MKDLRNADIFTNLRIVQISDNGPAEKLSAYGVGINSYVVKIDSDSCKHATLKVFGRQKNITVPGRLAGHVTLRISKSRETKKLYDIAEGKSGTVDEIDDSGGIKEKLAVIGIKEGMRLKLLRRLPHMEYSVLVENKRRVKITEATAAAVIGKIDNRKKQLSLARKGKPFTVEAIAQEGHPDNFLSASGIVPGAVLMLEGIEAGKDIRLDGGDDIYIYTVEGFRLSISNDTARKIIVVQE